MLRRRTRFLSAVDGIHINRAAFQAFGVVNAETEDVSVLVGHIRHVASQRHDDLVVAPFE
jgi:hypothetical protein